MQDSIPTAIHPITLLLPLANLEAMDLCDTQAARTLHVPITNPQSLFSLQLRNVQIDESKPSRGSSLSPSPKSQELRRLLETSPLRFAFQDGVVAELCPDRQEDPWALNVKRGLLSALQNSMDTLQGEQSVQEVRGHTALG